MCFYDVFPWPDFFILISVFCVVCVMCFTGKEKSRSMSQWLPLRVTATFRPFVDVLTRWVAVIL